jgi:hypothetical protein
MKSVVDGVLAAGYKSIAYLVVFFTALAFVGWVVQHYWVQLLIVSLVIGAVRLVYYKSRYW